MSSSIEGDCTPVFGNQDSWFTSLHDHRESPSVAETRASPAVADDVSLHSEAQQAQHDPDEGLQASGTAVRCVNSDVQQGSEEGAAQENAPSANEEEFDKEHTLLTAFLLEHRATPEGRKAFIAMSRAMRRLGKGPTVHRLMHEVAQRTAPSLRAAKSRTTIGVQPTAVARRKVPLGGRKRVHAGRPVSAAQSAGKILQVAKRRKAPAPHSLARCVESNSSLGKAH